MFPRGEMEATQKHTFLGKKKKKKGLMVQAVVRLRKDVCKTVEAVHL